jgi:hypothetical protein
MCRRRANSLARHSPAHLNPERNNPVRNCRPSRNLSRKRSRPRSRPISNHLNNNSRQVKIKLRRYLHPESKRRRKALRPRNSVR